MTGFQKMFRYVWRINALLILVAAGVAVFLVGTLLIQTLGESVRTRRQAKLEVPVGNFKSDAKLALSRAQPFEGTNVLRAQLSLNRDKVEFGSGGGGSETRNILFIDPGENTARWLLPDNDHVIEDSIDVVETGENGGPRREIATAIVVKPQVGGSEADAGKLLIFDPPAKKIVEVDDHVQEIQIASATGGDLTILYKQDRKLVLALLDTTNFSTRRVQQVQIPQLK